MGKKFMGYNNASELITAIGNKIKAKYTKPSGGIPKSDLATAVQTSLGKADSAVQPATMTEALAAKQNSLSETQLAAVNSGINSTKVGQIETNKENVLYSLDKVGTNCASIDNAKFTAIGEDRYLVIPCDNITGNIHIHVDSITSDDTNANTCAYIINYTDGTSSPAHQFSRGVTIDENLNLESNKLESIQIYPSNTYSNSEADTLTLTNFMVTLKAIWDQFPTFTPASRPNSDLTSLEAEDRAALAEVVDSGAKNKLKIFTSAASSSGRITGTSLNGVMSVSFSSISGTEYMKVSDNFSLPVGTYVLSGLQEKTSDSSSALTYYLHLEKNSALIVNEFGEGAEFTVTNASDSYALYVAVTLRATGSPKTVKPMICTIADWKVSQKFVPYRKNLDQLDSMKAPVLQNANLGGLVDSGSLNDETSNRFAVYTSNVTNRPTNDSTYYYVRTSYFDTNATLQEAFAISSGKHYTRVRYSDSWTSWLQSTNS